MAKEFIRSGPIWTFVDRDQMDGEHCFAELEIHDDGDHVFIQVDYFDSEFTFSASKQTARPFFEENEEGSAELPQLLEIFDEIPSSSQSQYTAFYVELKDLLDQMIIPQKTMTTADGMKMLKQFLANRKNNKKNRNVQS